MIGVIFAPIGGALLYASSVVQEISINYSRCSTDAPICPEMGPVDDDKIVAHFKNSTDPADAPTWCRNSTTVGYGLDGSKKVRTPQCYIQFYIPDRLSGPVLLYYQLTNFYQNHRRYVQSFDQDQLKGSDRDNKSVAGSDCDPLQLDADGKAYYPCGLIANSLFNDTFFNPVGLNPPGSNDGSKVYNMTSKGTAWGSDKDLYGTTKYKYGDVVPPPNWREQYPEYSENFPFKDLHEDDAFQVWMRTAGLPYFSKLALRNDDDEPMEMGRYEIRIYDCEFARWVVLWGFGGIWTDTGRLPGHDLRRDESRSCSQQGR